MNTSGNRRCIALLGGSFDPVHNGHVALAEHFATLLHPEELRLVPAGDPWQKSALHATPPQRIEMLRRAFSQTAFPVVIDEQEIRRDGPTYTIDTLRAIRNAVGQDVSLAFLIGADQLQKLNTWKEWRQLFDYAHVCAASRPGFDLDSAGVPEEVRRELLRRIAEPEQIRTTPHGLACVSTVLAVDISSTAIRHGLHRHEQVASLVPAGVLDYIEQHYLYQN